MSELNSDYAELWAEIKSSDPSIGVREYYSYWRLNAAIERIAEKRNVSADVVREVLGSAPDGWDADAV